MLEKGIAGDDRPRRNDAAKRPARVMAAAGMPGSQVMGLRSTWGREAVNAHVRKYVFTEARLCRPSKTAGEN
jgi:hypothetical protein